MCIRDSPSGPSSAGAGWDEPPPEATTRSAKRSSTAEARGPFSSRQRASTRSRHASRCSMPRHGSPARARAHNA
eukprot:13989918-Alexandrium_andersonii.AAC.1